MRLIDADELKKKLNFVYYCAYIESKSKEGIASDIIDEIDNAPTIDISGNEYFPFRTAYFNGVKDGRATARPQGDLADEVWKLYEKYQSHLATHVIEFGDELKDLLGKYQKGGAE